PTPPLPPPLAARHRRAGWRVRSGRQGHHVPSPRSTRQPAAPHAVPACRPRTPSPETTKPRSRGAPCVSACAPDLLLGDGLLRHGLLRRGLGHGLGGGLLRDRRCGRTGRLRSGLAAGVAVAGVVALALGRLAVALAHM